MENNEINEGGEGRKQQYIAEREERQQWYIYKENLIKNMSLQELAIQMHSNYDYSQKKVRLNLIIN